MSYLFHLLIMPANWIEERGVAKVTASALAVGVGYS